MTDRPGIGRQKELQLDEMTARVSYVARQIGENESGDFLPLATLIVAADVLHDVEKKLAQIVHQLEARW